MRSYCAASTNLIVAIVVSSPNTLKSNGAICTSFIFQLVSPMFDGIAAIAVADRVCTLGIDDDFYGEVAEWLKAPVSKTGISGNRDRGFESRPLRQ